MKKNAKVTKKIGSAAPKKSAPQPSRAIPAAKAYKSVPGNSVDATISHKEFVGAFTSNASAFTLIGLSGLFPGYDLNPGIPSAFPWLSGIAHNYEKYRFEKVVYTLVPHNPTSAAGAVYLAFDYDWDDSVAANIDEMMANKGAIASDVWTPVSMAIDMSRVNQDVPWRYVESAAREINSQRMTYGGFLLVAQVGAATTLAYDLFVDYTIRLSLPAMHMVNSVASYTTTAPFTVPGGGSAPLPILPTVSGIRGVVSGAAGTPNLGTLPAGTPAYAVPAGMKGVLNVLAAVASAGVPPSTFANDTKLLVSAYDQKGGLVHADVVNYLYGLVSWLYPSTAGTWGTNGADGYTSNSIALNLLSRLLPNVAYLAYSIYSTAGRTLLSGATVQSKYVEL